MLSYMANKEATMKTTLTQSGYITRIVGVVEAECPSDGGKWAIMCEHLEDGRWLNGGIIQDTNKRRLAEWKNVKRGGGFTEWCPACQEEHATLEAVK